MFGLHYYEVGKVWDKKKQYKQSLCLASFIHSVGFWLKPGTRYSLFIISSRNHQQNMMQSSLALIERCTVFFGECVWRKRSCNENEYHWVNQGFARVQWQADVPIWTYRAWIVAQGHFIIYITGVICLLDVYGIIYVWILKRNSSIFLFSFFVAPRSIIFPFYWVFHSFCFHSK